MQKITHRWLVLMVVLLLAVGLHTAMPTYAAQRCFSETNQCIDGHIREFWEQNGSLPVFGLPIASQELAVIDGKNVTIQRFERKRATYLSNLR